MTISVAAPTSVAAPQGALRPTFVGTLKGELLKIARQRTIWIMSVLLLGLLCAPYVFYLARPALREQAQTDPLGLTYNLTESGLAVVRVFGGVYLLILAALVIGLEYQQGTIRILLARGVGKLQLLGAKVLAIALAALAIVVADLLVQVIATPIFLGLTSGSLKGLSALDTRFWSDSWLYLLTVLISMAVTILLGVGVTVLGRSLAFGLGVGLCWFAADNIGGIVLMLMAEFTHNTGWYNPTAYFLGPLLNHLPALVVPDRTITIAGEGGPVEIVKQAATIGFKPLVPVTETHALLVILAYAAVFAVAAIVLTWRRDVLE